MSDLIEEKSSTVHSTPEESVVQLPPKFHCIGYEGSGGDVDSGGGTRGGIGGGMDTGGGTRGGIGGGMDTGGGTCGGIGAMNTVSPIVDTASASALFRAQHIAP